MTDTNKAFTTEPCDCGRGYWKIYEDREPECACAYCRGEYLMEHVYFPEEELEAAGLNKQESYFIPAEEKEMFYEWFDKEGYIVATGSEAEWLYPAYRTPHALLHKRNMLHRAYKEAQAEYQDHSREWTLTYRDTLAEAISRNAHDDFFRKYAAAVIDLVTYFDEAQLKKALAELKDSRSYADVKDPEFIEGILQSVGHPNYTDSELDASVPNVIRCLEHAVEHFTEYQAIVTGYNAIYDRDIRPLEEKAEELWPQEADLMLEDEIARKKQTANHYDCLFNEIWSAYSQYKNEMMYESYNHDANDDPDGYDDSILYIEE